MMTEQIPYAQSRRPPDLGGLAGLKMITDLLSNPKMKQWEQFSILCALWINRSIFYYINYFSLLLVKRSNILSTTNVRPISIWKESEWAPHHTHSIYMAIGKYESHISNV